MFNVYLQLSRNSCFNSSVDSLLSMIKAGGDMLPVTEELDELRYIPRRISGDACGWLSYILCLCFLTIPWNAKYCFNQSNLWTSNSNNIPFSILFQWIILGKHHVGLYKASRKQERAKGQHEREIVSSLLIYGFGTHQKLNWAYHCEKGWVVTMLSSSRCETVKQSTKRNKIGALCKNLYRPAIDGDIFHFIFTFAFL